MSGKGKSNGNGRVVRRVYLDYAASTPVDKRVIAAMELYWNGASEGDRRALWGNSVSVHAEGRSARDAVEDVRMNLARLIGAKKEEIIFTSGGTEGNNLSIFGVAHDFVYRKKKELKDLHFITASTEHPSVLDCFKVLEERGAEVTYLGVDTDGLVHPDEVRGVLKENTILVSIAYANNETGVVQPISKIARIIREHREKNTPQLPASNFPLPFFHTDASQAALFLNCNTAFLGADLATFDAHKLYAPKGIGFLYKKTGVSLYPLFQGGNQEMNLRPGTLATPLIVGLGASFEIAVSERDELGRKLASLRDYFIDSILKRVPQAVLNGHRVHRLPNNVNISIPGLESDFFVVVLDKGGIAASARSACLGEDGKGSYVIRAMGGSEEEARSSLRFTLGKTTTKSELDRVVDVLERETKKRLP